MNVVEIEEAVAELAKQPFRAGDFIAGFMAAYGAPKATLARSKTPEGNGSDLPGGVLWRKWLHFKPSKSGQITQDLDALDASKKTAQGKVRFTIACDGAEFGARDLKTGEALFCPLAELENRFGFFLPIAGIDRYEVADENPIDIKATGKLAKLYDALIADNPDWTSDAHRHAMHQFMIRIIFCLFGEDTGIFPDHLFSKTIVDRCDTNPANVAPTLDTLFEVMNLSDKDGSRKNKPNWASQFPYVNGGLFAEAHQSPKFSRTALRYLIEAGRLDWKVINPDIFGSMIQTIVNADERGELGMHYTSVPNILKVLNPLFLDELRGDVRDCWGSKKGLRDVLNRLTNIRILDPACGSGNFLVIAYREMREIEIRVLQRLQELTGEMAGIWSHVELSHFYGIEYKDFAAETAKLALQIAEYQMNRRYQDAFGKVPPELPLRDGAKILCANALRTDWRRFCGEARKSAVEIYVAGNPPYLGYNKQSADQKRDLQLCCEKYVKNWKSLDYVSGWIFKASEFIGDDADAALVCTNSINQGENAALIWDKIFKSGTYIAFAYQSFRWSNNAAKKAQVTCSIVGMSKRQRPQKIKKLYLPDGTAHSAARINQYLLDADTIQVKARNKPLSALAKMTLGSMAKDGGNLLLSPEEADDLIRRHARAAIYIKPFYGSDEFINGSRRFCIWVTDSQYEDANKIEDFHQRFERVRQARLKSPAASTRSWSEFPYKFKQVQKLGNQNTIIIPRVSSERRPYLPVGALGAGTVVSDLAFTLADAPLWNVALIASRIHLIWIATVCGKLESRYRYSNTLGWHTFPVPALTDDDKRELSLRAESILDAREKHFPASVADLYKPDKMPVDLREAHQANDEAIEKIYVGRLFRNDTERLEHLFKLYTKMVGVQGEA
jgi:hypothetical protein